MQDCRSCHWLCGHCLRGKQCRHSGNGCRLHRRCECVYVCVTNSLPSKCMLTHTHAHARTHTHTHSPAVSLKGLHNMGAIKHRPSLISARLSLGKEIWGNRRLCCRKSSFSACLFVGFPFPVKRAEAFGGNSQGM